MSVRGQLWRCRCHFAAYSSRGALIHLTKSRNDAAQRHEFDSEEYDLPIPQFLEAAVGGIAQNHQLDIDQAEIEQNDHQQPDAPQVALQHDPPALDIPLPAQLEVAAVAHVVAPVVAQAQGPPGVLDYGPFLNWSSLHFARIYADADMSCAKMKQVQHLVNDPRFVGSDVNVMFLARCNIRNVNAVIQHEKLRYGLAAPVPFQCHSLSIDGICYEFYYRDLFAVALQLFTTSTTTKEDGFQYTAFQEFGENGRVFTSACTG